MPGMDGTEATRQLIGSGHAAAHPHPEDLRPGHYIYGALCAGAGGFLLKDVAGGTAQ
jgi:hypothetical protein